MKPIIEASPASGVPLIPFSEDQREKYVLHETGNGHYIITLNGRVFQDSHQFTESEIHELLRYNRGHPVRLFLDLNWLTGPGRKAGCFEAEPHVAYSPYIERSFEEIQANLNQCRQEWDASEAKVGLQKHIARIVKYNHLTNVVSFDEGRPKEHFARCFAQDPAYTDLDKKLLRSMGIEPVDDPDGFMLIGNDSVVCEWATYDYITRKISERPWPAVVINGSGELEKASKYLEKDQSAEYDLSCQVTSIEARRVFEMLKDREQLPLSAFPYLCDLSLDSRKEDNHFWQPTIYWRKGPVTASDDLEDLGNAAFGQVS
ncbi:MAG: hypothetical protein L6R42_003244 [Xanthoria sp. 1 TBL-2021]|nr:MAG: hypothetical protein L6R42_003244 [Xanthoria sp. 1 TBL-2021]